MTAAWPGLRNMSAGFWFAFALPAISTFSPFSGSGLVPVVYPSSCICSPVCLYQRIWFCSSVYLRFHSSFRIAVVHVHVPQVLHLVVLGLFIPEDLIIVGNLISFSRVSKDVCRKLNDSVAERRTWKKEKRCSSVYFDVHSCLWVAVVDVRVPQVLHLVVRRLFVPADYVVVLNFMPAADLGFISSVAELTRGSKHTVNSRMITELFLLSLKLALVLGSSLSDQVHQTPFNILAKRGEAARISCSHNIQSYNVILWYKRLEDKQLQLLGYMYIDNKNPEPGTDVKMELDGNANEGQTCTLTIKELREKSSAVYYCAARYHSSSLSDRVRQTPAEMFHEPGENATISCTHGIDNYDVILWYKHSTSRQMQLLGYNDVVNGYPEPGAKVKISGSASKDKNSTLTLERLSMSSSAVYFCAARYHSASRRRSPAQKPRNVLWFLNQTDQHSSFLQASRLILCPLTGSSPSDQIVQIPADMFKNPGETAKISCTHSIPDYDRVLWYKQSKLHEMTLLGYMLGDDGYPEKEINVNIDGSANKDKNSTLTVAELSPDSSAVYYCAARYHSAEYHCCSVQKPPHSDQVHQTPFNILAKRGEAARISCSHNIQSYNVILWYKRLEDKQLQLLGYRYKDNTNPEPGTDVKLEMDGIVNCAVFSFHFLDEQRAVLCTTSSQISLEAEALHRFEVGFVVAAENLDVLAGISDEVGVGLTDLKTPSNTWTHGGNV
ncbi:hypothetical protein CCH79_00007867 [Gambusia affinis]|uniref:Ig-like domain-containing protein n=1 Tax=Gambusia affinis TaxID=33528 RepID=A0A315W0Y4_GAMAF|nr:hypothetical protein CCH79_00007867 [Gambusia affinis]